MKRIALLIGNSDGLPGVNLDIANWKKFLMSDKGGLWYENEIRILMNPEKIALLSCIKAIKDSKPDFAIIVFSGHGAYRRSMSTVLEINKQGEKIDENNLIGIAPRQISVFDCCREVLSEKLLEWQNPVQIFAEGGVMQLNIRPYYDNRMMEAMPQQICLYACSVGESVMDTVRGGIYTDKLLRCSSSFRSGECYKLIKDAHNEARYWTRTVALTRCNYTQNPELIFKTECPSEPQLIIGINPKCFKREEFNLSRR